MTDRDVYYSDFERDGEDAVRANLALKRYGEKKAPLAEAWLREKERARADAAAAEALDLTRRGTEADESSAKSAREANRIAIRAEARANGALWIAGGSFLVAVIALLVGR